jgi:protein phosphatase
MRINTIGMTDKGARRQNNEDAFVVLPGNNYSAVADGMGGAAAGEVASRIFVDTVSELFHRLDPHSEDEVKTMIGEAFRQGNERIIKSAHDTPEFEGMGCTAELIAFFADRYLVGHVGDSRTYLFRAGELRQITKDHSLVQHQVDQGIITALEARSHAMKNVVLRALGVDPSLSLDIVRGRVLPDDLFLLCSDGLTDMLDDAEIGEILASGLTIGEKVAKLINCAITAGGRDNVTAVLCQAIA